MHSCRNHLPKPKTSNGSCVRILEGAAFGGLDPAGAPRTRHSMISHTVQQKPESLNMTVLQPQSLEKKENQHKSHRVPIFWSLLYLCTSLILQVAFVIGVNVLRRALAALNPRGSLSLSLSLVLPPSYIYIHIYIHIYIYVFTMCMFTMCIYVRTYVVDCVCVCVCYCCYSFCHSYCYHYVCYYHYIHLHIHVYVNSYCTNERYRPWGPKHLTSTSLGLFRGPGLAYLNPPPLSGPSFRTKYKIGTYSRTPPT